MSEDTQVIRSQEYVYEREGGGQADSHRELERMNEENDRFWERKIKKKNTLHVGCTVPSKILVRE